MPRLTRTEALQRLTPQQMSFLGESRRLDNTRMKRELGLRLRYPSIDAALRQAAARTLTAKVWSQSADAVSSSGFHTA